MRKVQKRQLEMNRAVKIIELIVDVLKLDGLCVVAVRYAAGSDGGLLV